MTAYATAKGYAMLALPNGLNYQIINAGNATKPSATSKVFVRYTGKFISNETVFDQQSDHTKTGWPLNQLILGWQSGLPLIGEGGSMRLIVPSSLAYGCSGNGLPANSILYFDIELVDVQ
jgi:FKBP-type peptidyl-prolyl cis-trans isomerase